MTKPLVSILIPAYNAERWIANTIRSAVAQTWEPKEVIIVDDGSTDETVTIARQFASESVRVVSQQNEGAAAARNRALSLSTGDYIQWLDADDLLAADKIQRQIEVLDGDDGDESRRTLLSGSWGRFIYRPRRAEFTPTALWCDLSPAEFLVRKLGQKIFMQTAVWLVSRELAGAAGPWDTRMLSDDDGEYFCRVMLASERIRFVPEARVFYRDVGAARLSYVGRSNTKLEALWLSMQLHIRYLRSMEDNARTRAASLKYLQNYVATFYRVRPDIVQEMQRTAALLGGNLEAPQLPWKYRWIKHVAGWDVARRAQLALPRLKWSVIRFWDRVAARIEASNPLPSPQRD